jgi:predicted nucleotidyltransferase
MFPLEQHTIFLALSGSLAHGTAREGSDVDVRGVARQQTRMPSSSCSAMSAIGSFQRRCGGGCTTGPDSS